MGHRLNPQNRGRFNRQFPNNSMGAGTVAKILVLHFSFSLFSFFFWALISPLFHHRFQLDTNNTINISPQFSSFDIFFLPFPFLCLQCVYMQVSLQILIPIIIFYKNLQVFSSSYIYIYIYTHTFVLCCCQYQFSSSTPFESTTTISSGSLKSFNFDNFWILGIEFFIFFFCFPQSKSWGKTKLGGIQGGVFQCAIWSSELFFMRVSIKMFKWKKWGYSLKRFGSHIWRELLLLLRVVCCVCVCVLVGINGSRIGWARKRQSWSRTC